MSYPRGELDEAPEKARITDRYCPTCGGLGTLLGQLGALLWYRCRHCGTEFNRPVSK